MIREEKGGGTDNFQMWLLEGDMSIIFNKKNLAC